MNRHRHTGARSFGSDARADFVLVLASFFVVACGSSDSGGTIAPPTAESGPLSLDASWTYGDALCGAPSADGALFVSAEGAALTVLDGLALAAGQNVVLARAPIEAAPYALACDPPYVFVAGGTAGLWRVTIADHDVVGTVAGTWHDEVRILDADEAAVLDVESLPHHAAGPLVAAVSSARPGFGTSELLVVDRDPPHAVRARVALTSESAGPAAKAYALAADPSAAALIYVAMGAGGIWRIDLTDLSRPLVEVGPVFDRPEELLGSDPASARDIACVRAGERTILFAAIEAGGLAQIELSAVNPFGPGMATSRARIECAPGCGSTGVPYGFRVSAVGRTDGSVIAALATNSVSAGTLEGGPYSCLGRWNFDLGLAGPTGASIGCGPRTFLLHAGPLGGSDAVAPSVEVMASACRSANARSIDIVLRGASLLLFEQRFDGAQAFALDSSPESNSEAQIATSTSPYRGTGLACVDGTASEVDPGFLYFGLDGISLRPAGVPRFDIAQATIEIVSDTVELCATGTAQFCNSQDLVNAPPSPWTNSIAGGARWIDAADPGREWFAAGESRVSRQCPVDPCAWTDDWCADPWQQESDGAATDSRPPGWEIVRLDTGAASAGGPAMDMRFWSIASPPDAFGWTGRNYMSSAITEEGRPLLHLFRGSIRDGYLVCSADEVVDLALGSCGAAGGRGQRIEPTWMHALTTHFELAPDASPAVALTFRGEPFALEVGDTRRSYVAIAAGWVVPTSSAPWAEQANRSSVVIYDVTDVDAQNPPVLARIALGPRAPSGTALAVRVAEIGGRTWMFVGDLAGAVHAYDVSVQHLVDAAPVDPTDPASALESHASWYAPPDAYDGERANVTDLEIDFDTDPSRPVLVLANARRGLAVLDVAVTGDTIELVEADGSPIDTPGVASGLIPIRRNGTTWFAVGDARCGIRVYRRGG